jgi:IclR family acetate operon transcriptional repressor
MTKTRTVSATTAATSATTSVAAPAAKKAAKKVAKGATASGARTKADTAAPPLRTETDVGPRSLIRTLRILEHLAAAPDGMTLAALSVDLHSPKSSLLALLRPLCSYGYIVSTKGRYVLGPAAYRLGVSIMPTLSMSRIAVPIMRELVDQCEETVLIAVLDRETGQATYIEKIESTRSIRYTVPIGTSRPLYCSSAGRVLLAYSDREYIDHYLKSTVFTPLTKQTLTRPDELRKLLSKIREQRLEITIGEVSSDVAGFAAPIFDHQGRVIAALAMAAPVNRAHASQTTLATRVRDAAENISFGFGYADATLKAMTSSDGAPTGADDSDTAK